ncbi:MAG: Glu/Leu/Phe/Val dehydrogenase dimerization domain-containing protein [Blastocatellales bacterium]
MIETLISRWDGESVITKYEKDFRAWIFIAIHSTVLGPAAGGTRMKIYGAPGEALLDAMRLAEGMTLKYAVADFPRGGGKAVIGLTGELDCDDRIELLRRYGMLVRSLRGAFLTGPDVGTTSEDMDIIHRTGSPYIFSRTAESGGAGSSGYYTAIGVYHGMRAVCRSLFGDPSPAGRRICLQGVGSVGATLVELARNDGAELVVTDVNPAALERFAGVDGISIVSPEEIYDDECDIFSPCAMGGVLNERTIPRLRCRAIVGAANNQLESETDAKRLKMRGILYAPDFAVNIGGAMAVTGIEGMGWPEERALQEVARVEETVARIFEISAAEGITTDAAARMLARERLSKV